MAKKRRKKEPEIPVEVKADSLERWMNWKYLQLVLSGLLILFILIFFSPMVFAGYRPGGVDVIGSKGANHQIKEWEEQTGEKAMWNPTQFSGTPTYHHFKTVWFVDTFVEKWLGTVIYNPILYYIIGAFGMCLLFRQLGFHPLLRLFGALAFVLTVHWATLLDIGHFMKFRPIMLIPLLVFTFIQLWEKPKLLSFASFAIVLAWQIRTQHFQIVFYTALMLIFIGKALLWTAIRKKEQFITRLILMFLAGFLAIGIVAQPLASMKEYTPFSIRGGTGEAESDESKKSTGVDINYATNWSLHPSEAMGFVIPRFHGGVSSEYYHGSENPNLTGKRVPGYWGHMPFTQTSQYMGIVIVFLALLGIMVYWKKPLIVSLVMLTLFSYLLAMGRHFNSLYQLFFDWVPFFNKFRVPAMIVVIINVSVIFLAMFGLKALFQVTNADRKKLLQKAVIAAGLLLVIALGAFAVSGNLAYTTAQETAQLQQQYGANAGRALDMYKDFRKEFLTQDTNRMILYLLLTISLVIGYLINLKNGKGILTNRWLMVGLLLVLMVIDMGLMQSRYLLHKENSVFTNLRKDRHLETSHFKQTPLDKYMMEQQDEALEFGENRVYPVVANIWNTNDYGYYHQPIGGYSPAKLRVYQDLKDFGTIDGQYHFTRNIPDMLNARFFLSERELTTLYPGLRKVSSAEGTFLYENPHAAGRAWFVENYVVETSRADRFKRMRDAEFDIHNTAILESELSEQINPPDSLASVKVMILTPHKISFETSNRENSLLVVSEVFYPVGWKATVDGNETPIYKTNHVLRSVYIPAGKHTVEFSFNPPALGFPHYISLFCTLVIFLILSGAIVMRFRLAKADSA
ncbi:MAG: YfhO family protein [Candidatus Cloacimonetes bacterium]|nr:YfhO family protein [Candidatus Cloacimonadota bacterium]